MNRPPQIARLVGFAIIALTIVVTAVTFFVVRSDVEKMRLSGRENILWSAVQVEIELMRFEYALVHFSAGDPETTPRLINDRFDILWSRVLLFQHGSVGKRLRAYDEREATVAVLFSKMKEVEPQITGLKIGDKATSTRLEQTFKPFARDLRRLSREVLLGEEIIGATQREDLSKSSALLAFLSGITVLASLMMIYLFAREARQFRKLAQSNAQLLRSSNIAGSAKSQFLAMMSHELRTPMNGVLGLLMLVKQQGLNNQQNRLVDQAERSGQQMISLLEDILDFAALQDGRLELERKPFSPAELAKAVHDTFRPMASREGTEFTARADQTCPERVMGDFGRMRQALTHLATYLLETAGARNITLDLGYREGCLVASISFDYSQVGGEWEPELIMGNAAPSSNGFASEALGPAVSRGLIDRMGGSTKLDNPASDRIAVLVNVPAEKMVVDILLIKIVCQSAALEVICRAALRAENVRFMEAEDETQPHVLILEGGGEQETAFVRRYAKLHPGAILVALGRPTNPDFFDDIVDVPIDVLTIRQAGFMALATNPSYVQTEDIHGAENRSAT